MPQERCNLGLEMLNAVLLLSVRFKFWFCQWAVLQLFQTWFFLYQSDAKTSCCTPSSWWLHHGVGLVFNSWFKKVIFFFFSVMWFFLPDVEFILNFFFSLELETVLSYAKFNKTAEPRCVVFDTEGGDVGMGRGCEDEVWGVFPYVNSSFRMK